jgi:glycosyltransferase involved in cell wall biosynthesis
MEGASGDCLYIIIPAYNEAVNIPAVAREWHEVVAKTAHGSRLVIINDGSKDNTKEILESLREELPLLHPITKPNGGHGSTVLYGYDYAMKNGADFVFQTDSDGQTLPAEFWPFWEHRHEYAAQIGHRNRRKDGFSRVFVTKTLKFVLWFVFRISVTDANTPFRLIRTDILRKYVPKIPENFNLSNVMLTVCLLRFKEKVRFIPITFRPRQGGVNSINLPKIFRIGWQAIKDFRRIKKELAKE